MGRSIGKLKVELIENQKSRKQTFKRRGECVLRKIKELSTLCDVSACLVIFSPDDPASVWPPNDPALVDRLVRRKLDDSKNDDDDDDDDFALRVEQKAQLVSAQIERLKRVADQQQDQFFASTAMMVMPAGGGNRDDDGKAQFDVDVHKKAQLARDLIIEDAQQQQQDQLGHSIFDQLGHSIFDQFPEQQQQFDLFGGSSYQGEDDSMMMMMMDDAIFADQSCGIMAGFDEGASSSTQTAGVGDDVAAVQDCNLFNHAVTTGFDGQDGDDVAANHEDDFVAQLNTPPRMMWQSAFQENGDEADVAAVNFYNQFDDDFTSQLITPPMMTWQSTFTHGAADYSKCIDFDDLWV